MYPRTVATAVCLSLLLSLNASSADSATQPAGDAKTEVLLWPADAPGATGDKDSDKPSLTLYLAKGAERTQTAVVVCPGGGYAHLAVEKEGVTTAKWLNSLGVSAFVLRYRLAPYRHPIPLGDAQRAIRTVRARAGEWQIDPHRVGIIGFSAGGHLASTTATHFDNGSADAADLIDRLSSRPDFAILCYPVITFTRPYLHAGSMRNLLGNDPDPKLIELLSNEKQVTRETPPTFLFHTGADKGVPVQNSLMFYSACLTAGVPAELHVFERGPHGVGLAATDPALSAWPGLCANWLRVHGFVPAKTQ